MRAVNVDHEGTDPAAEPVGETASEATESAAAAAEAGAPSRGRQRVRAFIVIAVVAQLLIPLTYYLRDDPYDERFAWRMFSGIRLQQCETTAFETRAGGERTVDLFQVVQAGWVEQLRRNRRAVVAGYLARRCQEEGVSSVRLVNVCRQADGTDVAPIEYGRDCTTGETRP